MIVRLLTVFIVLAVMPALGQAADAEAADAEAADEASPIISVRPQICVRERIRYLGVFCTLDAHVRPPASRVELWLGGHMLEEVRVDAANELAVATFAAPSGGPTQTATWRAFDLGGTALTEVTADFMVVDRTSNLGRFETAGTKFRSGERRAPPWPELDLVILEALNAGASLAQANRMLRFLDGFADPHRETPTVIGDVAFLVEAPVDASTYELRMAGSMLIGVYASQRTPWRGHGHLSVFTQRRGGWSRTGALDAHADRRLEVYPVPSAASPALVTMESFQGGDRSEGDLRVWTIDGGVPRPHGAALRKLVDYQIAVRAGGIVISYDVFPRAILEPVMGKRIPYELAVRLEDGRPQLKRTCTAPWRETIERFYAELHRKRRASARALVADSSSFSLLAGLRPMAMPEEEVVDATGGTVSATLQDDRGTIALLFRRGPHGGWLISATRPAL